MDGTLLLFSTPFHLHTMLPVYNNMYLYFRYNISHKSTRNIIERLNGVWKQRFPCLRRKLLTKPVTTQAIIISCAILHNIGILRRDVIENMEEDLLEAVPVANANAAQNPRGRIVRQQFIERHFY